jgi:hypothetical protein
MDNTLATPAPFNTASATDRGIKTAASLEKQPAAALADIARQLRSTDAAITYIFCASGYCTQELEQSLERYPNLGVVVGCSSEGEFSKRGYLMDSICAVSLPRKYFSVAVAPIENVENFRLQDASHIVNSLKGSMGSRFRTSAPSQMLAILLANGQAKNEERLCAALGAELNEIPLVGGTAGDNWLLSQDEPAGNSQVLVNGRFRKDCALLVLIHSRLKFKTYLHSHYKPTDRRAVITAMSSEHRTVNEIDGRPAVETYAELCGLEENNPSLSDFSRWPAIVKIGGQSFPRGPMGTTEDGGIRFACAMDEGVVINIAEPGDMVEELEGFFAEIKRELGMPSLILGFSCAARQYEMNQLGIKPQIVELMQRYHVLGFSTLGEQYNTIHANNSFTCVAFGAELNDQG